MLFRGVRLDNGVPFSSYTHDGCEKVCLNCWVDFVDIDDSEIVGGSEVYVLICGLRITKAALKKKDPSPARALYRATWRQNQGRRIYRSFSNWIQSGRSTSSSV